MEQLLEFINPTARIIGLVSFTFANIVVVAAIIKFGFNMIVRPDKAWRVHKDEKSLTTVPILFAILIWFVSNLPAEVLLAWITKA